MKLRTASNQTEKRMRDSLYLDSELVAKSGVFFIAITKGKLIVTIDEVTDFNKMWATEIRRKMGYDNYYLAMKIEEDLSVLSDRTEKSGVFLLTEEGIAEVLSSIQRFKRTEGDVSDYILVLDQMLKDNIASTKEKILFDRIDSLKNQIQSLYQIDDNESFNTNYSGNVLALRILISLSEIYNMSTYRSCKSQPQIGEMIRQIKERESRFHDILKNATNNKQFDSNSCLEIAKTIRKSKVEAYRSIYENIINEMSSQQLQRFSR